MADSNAIVLLHVYYLILLCLFEGNMVDYLFVKYIPSDL